MKRLRAISLWQPWASLMAIGAKHIETRSWPTEYRGLIAIHAAKKWNGELEDLCFDEPFAKCLFPDEFLPKPKSLPRGCIIAVGHLHRCLAMDTYPEAIPARSSAEYAFGNYEPGRFMWVFDYVWELSSPVYVRGQQGFWTLSEVETDVVTAMLPDDWEQELSTTGKSNE